MNYSDELVLLTYTAALAESLLHQLEQVTRSIGLYVNANKTDYMSFKQKGAISILSGEHLKIVDQFMYLSSNISSTESGVIICFVKVWNNIDKLLII